jgi:hypothetical protein
LVLRGKNIRSRQLCAREAIARQTQVKLSPVGGGLHLDAHDPIEFNEALTPDTRDHPTANGERFGNMPF